MKTSLPSTFPDAIRQFSPRLIATCFAAFAVATAHAQTYSVIDLSPAAGNGVATGISGGVAAGYAANAIYGTAARASVWTGSGTINLHPGMFDDSTTGISGRSYLMGIGGGLQVGSGAGSVTSNRLVPMVWRGSADTAAMLAIPFVNFGGQAQATDGIQIVGYATGLDRDGVLQGPSHAMVWDAATGSAVDLGDGGGGAIAYGVGGGQQVGYVIKSQAVAALWRGTRQSLVSLHPKDAVVSVANSTDGARQVGYAGYNVRVRQEAAKGNKEKRFNYAFVWTGTAASGLNIHPYPDNNIAGVNLTQSYALGMNGSRIVGYAGDETKFGTPAYSHAIVWHSDYQSIDLNAFLPAGFVGAQATGIDANGNISGFMAKADGTRHAVVWTPNTPQ